METKNQVTKEAKVKLQYVQASATQIGKKQQDVFKILKAGGKKLEKRLQERGIKKTDVVRVRHTNTNTVNAETKAVVENFERFYLVLKNGKNTLLNFSKFM